MSGTRQPITGTASAPQTAAVLAAQGLVRNALFLLLAYLVPRLLTFASVVVAARVLNPAAFGAYSTAAAFAVILSVVATLGMMPLLIRDLARAPERAASLLRAAHRVKTAANALMLVTLAALGWMLGFPAPVMAAALLLGLAYAVGAYVENLAAYFQAVERMQVWMQASAALGVVWGGMGTVLVLATSSLVWFCVAPVLGQLAALAWLVRHAPEEVRRGRAPPHHRDVLELLRAVLPFAAATIALTLYYKLDVLLLASWRSAEEVGIYSAAYKMVDIWQALMIVAVGAVYPRLARSGSPVQGRRWAGTRLTELVVLASVPCAAVLWLARGPLVDALFGADYRGAVPVLACLAAVLPPLGINILSGYVLASAGRMSHAAGLYAAAVPVNVSLNALLIPALGARGTALAMLVSEALLAAAFLLLLRERSAAPAARSVAVAGGALLLWGACALLPDHVPAGLAAGAYLLGVALLYGQARVITGTERRALRLAVRAPAPVPGSRADAVP